MFSSGGWISSRRPRRWWVKRRLRFPTNLRPVSLALLGLLQLGWDVRHVVTVRRLRTASSRAADDASAKSLFLRLASHEIRAPLALARGYVDIIRGETLGPVNVAMAEALGSVDQKLGQIEELVMQMVESARLDVDGPGLWPKPLDMRQIVQEAVAQITGQLGPEHDMAISLTDRPAVVMGERLRLRTLLVNLLSNAIKYSPDGGEVRCALSEHRRHIEVTVADRGIGLDPAQLRRLFQPFTRLPEGEKVAPSGLGLGLHLAQTIAEAHHGSLTAGANPGGGAIFTVSLPKVR